MGKVNGIKVNLITYFPMKTKGRKTKELKKKSVNDSELP